MEGVKYTGVPSAEELKNCPGVPSEERMRKGRVACVECVQEIPCNPCEHACPTGAIRLGGEISEAPSLDEEKCIGCGKCIAKCPGLAITVVNKAYAPGEASLDFPFEYLPLPGIGDSVQAVDRAGASVCEAKVLAVINPPENDGTAVIRIAFPLEYTDRVKSIKRLAREE